MKFEIEVGANRQHKHGFMLCTKAAPNQLSASNSKKSYHEESICSRVTCTRAHVEDRSVLIYPPRLPVIIGSNEFSICRYYMVV